LWYLVQYLYYNIELLNKDKKLLTSDISIMVVMLEGLGGSEIQLLFVKNQ